MMKSLFIRRKKQSITFKDFHNNWITTLRTTLLPSLSRSLSSSSPTLNLPLLSTQLSLLQTHFTSYFTALNAASNDDVPSLLFPDWRNPVEKPFLFLGDIHPYAFTVLLRSLLEDQDDDDEEESDESDDDPWKSVDVSLWKFVDQVERGLRLMVPAIVGRFRDAQGVFIEKVADGWRKESGVDMEEVSEEVLVEMTRVFLDVNRLRMSVLGDIMAALDVHQGALFLERLAKFYVGFWDPKLLSDFKKCTLSDLGDN